MQHLYDYVFFLNCYRLISGNVRKTIRKNVRKIGHEANNSPNGLHVRFLETKLMDFDAWFDSVGGIGTKISGIENY